MAEQKPGKGFLGWLGRQWGHLRKAVKTDVTRQVVHRKEQVQEAKLPDQPNVTLRRTVIDEVIVDKKPPAPQPQRSAAQPRQSPQPAPDARESQPGNTP